MKARSYFSERLKLIVDVLDGAITADEMLEVRLAAQARGWIRRGGSTLTIVRGEHVGLSPDAVAALAVQIKERIPELASTRTAIVASAPIATALAMLYSIEKPGHPTKVFSTLAAAAKWLCLPLREVIEDVPELAELAREL